METPTTIRRNPPRKAKLASAEKSTVKEYRTARKRYVAEGKALMPSFTAADGDTKLKLTVEASRMETLQAGTPLQRDTENPTDIGDCMPYDLQYPDSVHIMHACGRKNNEQGHSSQTSHFQCEASSLRKREKQLSNKVRVFLRIRPAQVVTAGKRHVGKVQNTSQIVNTSLQQGICPTVDICLQCQTPDCVTLITPTMYSGLHKPKEEEFNGFSRIFNHDSTQMDVFNEVLAPRLAALFEGESSLVVAMGPTSAGKTHTMLGSLRDPGLIPQSLQYLFASQKSKNVSTPMKLIISMFEIYSEQGGRSEKIFDLLKDGAELSLQQSGIKGLHEAVASTAEEADEIFSLGLQRRTTASTAANYQSSRSHCIFNISICQTNASTKLKRGTLTIADLAGFEREKKTKNQGVRLNESSFINNTSMVFGQCLRALLEHQKNPKKTMERHFQYSMLTRYLKPYMEAHGNMTLIVNVSPCEEDYLDTSFVLRQVAPYSKIRVVSMLTKENCEGLKVEKRSSSGAERQQPAKKRRKVDSLMIKSIGVYDLSEIGKSTGVSSDNCSQGQFNEVCTSQGEGGDLRVNDSMEAITTSKEVASPTNTLGVWKANLVTKINHILIQEGVKNCDRVSHAIVRVLDNGGHEHASEDLGRRLEEQQAEITFLRTNLSKEQQHASDLFKEVQQLKQQHKDLKHHIIRLEGSPIFNGEAMQGTNKDETSNFQKGKLLALALIQESKVFSEEDNGHVLQQVDCQSGSPSHIGTLGPIGHDLEEMLEVSLTDLVQDLWVVEVPKGSKLSELLARYCGVLDISNFARKYTHQRENCLRYCLAVVSGKMNVDGIWVPLSKRTISDRKRHFYGVIQAGTVAEAVGHAQAGFQVEALSKENLMETKEVDRAVKPTTFHVNSGVEAPGNKENACSSAIISTKLAKPDAAIKRRRLQPLSALSLHAGPTLRADLALADANVDEPKSHEGSPRSRVGTLAYLLTHQNRFFPYGIPMLRQAYDYEILLKMSIGNDKHALSLGLDLAPCTISRRCMLMEGKEEVL
ncbi:hypothetical protein GOP47_0012775 [Adiantum capillus-veneris]|uniref:Kinesin motor domain-containing protein n=1 Tax=Adiantum capillus-veneris TaxID=13818 RepID=A0A9D4ZEQ6_ADICA|nr:hypothetical protein GOP47_0012775 [Adiantum capillus-veneris]